MLLGRTGRASHGTCFARPVNRGRGAGGCTRQGPLIYEAARRPPPPRCLDGAQSAHRVTRNVLATRLRCPHGRALWPTTGLENGGVRVLMGLLNQLLGSIVRSQTRKCAWTSAHAASFAAVLARPCNIGRNDGDRRSQVAELCAGRCCCCCVRVAHYFENFKRRAGLLIRLLIQGLLAVVPAQLQLIAQRQPDRASHSPAVHIMEHQPSCELEMLRWLRGTAFTVGTCNSPCRPKHAALTSFLAPMSAPRSSSSASHSGWPPNAARCSSVISGSSPAGGLKITPASSRLTRVRRTKCTYAHVAIRCAASISFVSTSPSMTPT
jgi:hypothetical protein